MRIRHFLGIVIAVVTLSFSSLLPYTAFAQESPPPGCNHVMFTDIGGRRCVKETSVFNFITSKFITSKACMETYRAEPMFRNIRRIALHFVDASGGNDLPEALTKPVMIEKLKTHIQKHFLKCLKDPDIENPLVVVEQAYDPIIEDRGTLTIYVWRGVKAWQPSENRTPIAYVRSYMYRPGEMRFFSSSRTVRADVIPLDASNEKMDDWFGGYLSSNIDVLNVGTVTK